MGGGEKRLSVCRVCGSLAAEFVRKVNVMATGLVRFAAVLIMLAGAVFATAAWPATDGALVWGLDLVFWPLDGAQALSDEARFLAAVGGAVALALGVMIWKIAALEGAAMRGLMIAPLWLWFVVDSAGSVLTGAAPNVLINTGLMLLVLSALQMRRTD